MQNLDGGRYSANPTGEWRGLFKSANILGASVVCQAPLPGAGETVFKEFLYQEV